MAVTKIKAKDYSVRADLEKAVKKTNEKAGDGTLMQVIQQFGSELNGLSGGHSSFSRISDKEGTDEVYF